MWIIATSLPSAKEVCKGYVFTGVCLSTGGVSAPLHAGIHTPQTRGRQPPGADPPQSRPPGADTPCAVHAWRYGQQAGGTHPTGMHTCSHLFSDYC